MFTAIKKWWNRQFREPFTVACDLSAFPTPWTDREEMFHVRGIRAARSLMYRWIRVHPHGQARLLEGHIYWESAEADRARCEKEYKCADPAFHEEGYW